MPSTAGQRVLGYEQRRLCDPRLYDLLLRPGHPIRWRKQDVAQVQTEVGPERLRTCINDLTIERLGLVELPSHVHPLGPLAGEHEYDGRIVTGRHKGRMILDDVGSELCQRLGPISAHHVSAMVELVPPHLQRIGDVRQGQLGMSRQVPARFTVAVSTAA